MAKKNSHNKKATSSNEFQQYTPAAVATGYILDNFQRLWKSADGNRFVTSVESLINALNNDDIDQKEVDQTMKKMVLQMIEELKLDSAISSEMMERMAAEIFCITSDYIQHIRQNDLEASVESLIAFLALYEKNKQKKEEDKLMSILAHTIHIIKKQKLGSNISTNFLSSIIGMGGDSISPVKLSQQLINNLIKHNAKEFQSQTPNNSEKKLNNQEENEHKNNLNTPKYSTITKTNPSKIDDSNSKSYESQIAHKVSLDSQNLMHIARSAEIIDRSFQAIHAIIALTSSAIEKMSAINDKSVTKSEVLKTNFSNYSATTNNDNSEKKQHEINEKSDDKIISAIKGLKTSISSGDTININENTNLSAISSNLPKYRDLNHLLNNLHNNNKDRFR